jgi:hypothetical protein
LPPEKSEQGHIGSSPPEKGFGSVDADRARSIGAVAMRPTNAQPAHDSRTHCLGFADFSPVFLRSASIDASDVMGRRFKKAGGNSTVYDAGPARGSKCAIDHANFAVV